MTVTMPLSFPGKMSFVRSGWGTSVSFARSNSPVGPGGSGPAVVQPKRTTFSKVSEKLQTAGPRLAPAPPEDRIAVSTTAVES